jgi:hypothetical protein
MRRLVLPGSIALAICFLSSLPASAGKFTAADYPLRVLILFRNGTRHYHGNGGGISSLNAVDGLGEANLFENGQPTGFDFNYTCLQPITPTPAFETFMARWKKQGRVLQIVMPVMGGKPGDMNSCDLNVNLKQGTAYFRRNGAVIEEPSAQFKEWMDKHQYDPEHGKDMPVAAPVEQPASAQRGAAPTGVQ